MEHFKFKIIGNNGQPHEISEKTDTSNWTNYRSSLKQFQKNINVYLTGLVDNDNNSTEGKYITNLIIIIENNYVLYLYRNNN